MHRNAGPGADFEIHITSGVGDLKPYVARVSVLTYTDIRTGDLKAIEAFAKSHDLNCQLEHGTPLCLGAFEGRVKVVKLLLKLGADPNYQSGNRWTPLIAAANDGRSRIVEILLDAGADPNKQDTKGQGPLHHLCFCPRKSAAEVAKLLISRGADPLLKNLEGHTAYRVALDKRMGEGYRSLVSQDLVYALQSSE